MNARRAWLACIGVLGAGVAMAGSRRPSEANALVAQVTPTAAKTQFLVSAVLRKGTQDYTILLVHGRQPAISKDEAVGLFVRQTTEQYPGYSVMDTIASEFDLTQPSCHGNSFFTVVRL